MAHQLTTRRTGKTEMAFIQGNTPWHGLGQALQRGASIEQWIEAAGMDWKVQRSKVRYATAHGQGGAEFLEFPDQHVLFRSDTKAALGVVSDSFKIVQPRDVLEFFRDLTADNGFELETAGTLFGGRRFWALASIGEYTRINAEADVMKGYLLLSTACDGSMKTEARETTICVVCNNTLSAALSTKAKHAVAVSHRSVFDHNRVKDQLGIARGNFARFASTMRSLASAHLTTDDAKQLTLKLLAPQLADKQLSNLDEMKQHAMEVDRVRESRNFRSIMALFDGKAMGAQLPGREQTFWGWVNAVTEHVDHHASARTADNRLNSAWFGNGDDLKTEAVELALATV